MPLARPLLATLMILSLLLAGDAPGQVIPAKPYADLVGEVMAFLVSDVGRNGIRTNDDDPAGYPVPPYFYSYMINDWNNLDSRVDGYPGYLSVSYPAYTASVAIDAFLDWRRWSGDDEGLARARAYADWILEHRTPPADLYGNLPYSTQTDAVMGGGWDGPAIMTDKTPMFGLRLLRLYDITGEAAYWNGAVEIADVMAATQLTGPVEDHGRWPFRVVPADGAVTQDYTSHLQPAVRFFDAMADRTGNPAYTVARDAAWDWLLANPCDPVSDSWMRWEAFYEDQSPEMQTGKGDHYSGHEMIVELAARRPAGWEDLAVTLLDSLSARYLVTSPSLRYDPYTPITLEWAGWPEGTYASSLQYARTALLLHRALAGDPLQDDAWRQTALDMAAACSHGQNDRDVAADGRMFTTIRDMVQPFHVESWYEQNFNTVKYYLEIMDLEPSLAPAGEPHLLAADRALTSISYPDGIPFVEYATAGGAGRERIRVPEAPFLVMAGGDFLPQLAAVPDSAPGWYFDPVEGVLTVRHETSPVVVAREYSSAHDPGRNGGPLLDLRGTGPSGAGRAALRFSMTAPGEVDLEVYDLRGRRVRTLARASHYPPGDHSLVWDGRDDDGRTLGSGLYLVRGRSGPSEETTRLVLVR